MPSDLDIQSLAHQYHDGTVALSEITLHIDAGQFVLVAGANGSGKSTLLRHLNGLLAPTAGQIRVAGLDPAREARQVRQLVGMVFQDADLQIVGETVQADAAFGPENLGWSPNTVAHAVATALGEVGLAHLANRRPHTLSGGEKRRLAIAGVLAMRPKIVLMDEPLANLDYPGTLWLIDQCETMRSRGVTVIVAAHDVELLLPVADRLVVLQQGRVVRDGVPDIVIRDIEQFGVRLPWPYRSNMASRHG